MDRNVDNDRERLERELLVEYDSLNQRNPEHPLLGLIQKRDDGFVFTPLFNRHYCGGTIRRKYEKYVEELKVA